MDPLHAPEPDESGYVTVDSDAGVRLHYSRWVPRLRSAASASTHSGADRVILIMGAFATAAHWCSTADFLRGIGFEVGARHARQAPA